MDQTVQQLVAHAPGVAGVVMVMLIFLRYIQAAERTRAETYKVTSDKLAVAQEKTAQAIEANTKMMGRALAVIERHEKALDAIERRLNQ